MQILYQSDACCHAQPMLEKTVREQKHTRRTIYAETVCHTIYFWHEMIIVNARYSETCAWKGQAN